MLSRVTSLLFVAVLLLGLVIALDPQARSRAEAFVRDLDPTTKDETFVPTATAFATATPASDIQDTDNLSDEPIIVINWDALRDSLRELWDDLRNIRITTNVEKDAK